MFTDTEKIIMIKTAIALRLLLGRNKGYSENNKSDIIDSYEKIAINSNADIRKATVTNAFSGKKRSSLVTIILIVESMGYLMRDFAEIYDKLSEKDIAKFREKSMKK